ncbi:MAG: hypothetical protein KJZ84_09260 [Bryobacteraceae bacterium]|nr:hypothetical protein [Bryobacteraceae bacterium]
MRLTDVGADAETENQGAVVVGEVVVEPLLVIVLTAEGAGGGTEDYFDGGERKHLE